MSVSPLAAARVTTVDSDPRVVADAVAVLLQTRGVGELAIVSELPDAVVALFGLLTHLGDPWLLMASLGLVYLVADDIGFDRTRVAGVIAVGFGIFALAFTVKTGFALPRPPGAAADGYGFPSGHAMGAAAVWGAAAALFRVGTRRLRFATAGVVVALVAVSRVVIGVHYLVDVVVGTVVGVSFAVVALRLGPGLGAHVVTTADVERLLSLALGLSLVGLLVGVTTNGVFALGATVGAWGAWRAVGDRVVQQGSIPSRTAIVLSVGALPVIVGGLFLTEQHSPGLVIVGVVAAVLMAGLVSLPVLAGRLAKQLV